MHRIFVIVGIVAAGFMACIPDPPADKGNPTASRPLYDAGRTPTQEGGALGVSAVPADLDFGGGNCGGPAAATKHVALKNSGKESVEYSASLVGKGFTVAGALRGVVAPGADAGFDITPDAVPATAHAGELLQAVLKIETNDVTVGTVAVPLKVRATGAELTISPASVDFGSFPIGQTPSPSLEVTFHNKGNAPVDITPGKVTAPFQMVDSSKFTVLANASQKKQFGFTPSSQAPTSQPVSLTVTGALCGAAPSSLLLKGTGVVAGSPYVSPGSLDFGTTSCGDGAPAPQTVTLQNDSGATLAITATVDVPYYDVTGPATVDAGKKGVYVVTPKKLDLPISLADGAYNGALTLSGSGLPPIALKQAVQGAVFRLDATNLDFGQVLVGDQKDLPFVVYNDGNDGAGVSLALRDNSAFAVSLASTTVAPGSYPFTVTYYAATYTSNETMTVTFTGPMCSSPPVGLVSLRGEGVVTQGPDGGTDTTDGSFITRDASASL